MLKAFTIDVSDDGSIMLLLKPITRVRHAKDKGDQRRRTDHLVEWWVVQERTVSQLGREWEW